ncbi:MAG: Fic family protein [Bdellovibrionales bacterium]
MKRSDLTKILQPELPNPNGFGVAKGKTPSLKNIWFVVPPPPSETTPGGLDPKLLSDAHEVISQLPSLKVVTELDRLVLGLLVRREAVQSSRMEGTWSTIEQVLTPGELHDRREKSARASVIGYAHALESAFLRASTKGQAVFTKDLLRTMHKEMMSRDPDFRGPPGKFRHEIGQGIYATIGGFDRPENSTFNPVPPEFINKCLKHNLSWYQNEQLVELSQAGMGPSLIVRMARGHWHFEAVHPFTDGNGRVGRMLMALQMVCENYSPLYLSGFIETHKKAYGEFLRKAQMKLDEAPLIHFLAEAIVECWEESQKTKKALMSLPETWLNRGRFREGSAAKRSMEVLLGMPIVTIKTFQNLLEISQPAAKRAIDQLQSHKILRERTGLSRNRVFAAEEVIEILARPFRSPIEHALNKAWAVLGLK